MALVIRAPYPDAGGGMRLWLPTDAAMQPVRWFDPKDTSTMTMSGGLISQLRSKVGTTTSDASGGSQPAYSATARNGLPGAVFNGGNALTLSSLAGLPSGKQASTVAVVGYGAGGGGNQTFFSFGAGVAAEVTRLVGYNNDNAFNIWLSNVSSAEFNTPPSWLETDHVVISEQAAGDSPIVTYSVDGTTSSRGTGGSVSTGTTEAYIGQLGSFFGNLNGVVQEIVVYLGNLNSDDRPKLQGYLAWNNNQQANLPSGHSYKSAPPMVAA